MALEPTVPAEVATATSHLVVVEALWDTFLGSFRIFLCLSTDLIQFALVILPLFSKTRVVHCNESTTVTLILLHSQVCKFELGEVSLRHIFAAAKLFGAE